MLVVARLPATMVFRVYDGRPNLAERLADETDLMRFACWLGPPDGRLKTPGSVASHVSMVRTMHRIACGMDFSEGFKMHRLSQQLKGLAELYPCSPRDRHPATVSMFARWTGKLWWYSRRFCHVAAALELMFQAMLRAAETVPHTARAFKPDKHLVWARVAFVPDATRPRYVEVKIAPVKQANRGPSRHARLLPIVLPMADTPICACRALVRLRALRVAELGGSPPPPTEPVLRVPETGQPLAYDALLKWFRWLIGYLKDRSLDEREFALHSLRIGGATALLKAGCPPAVIQALGRWSSEIFHLYTRACFEDGLNWAEAMAKTDVLPLEIVSLLRKHGIATDADSSAIEREQGAWAEDDPDD